MVFSLFFSLGASGSKGSMFPFLSGEYISVFRPVLRAVTSPPGSNLPH
uniref:Uncharacterized protein n=1 Tax=Anguilla anguilla TaxID=7936 RepID=A0A0E9PD96_ANGAN